VYLTTTTLDTRMVGLTFDSVTTALATEMISDAEAEVNKWLSRRYDLSSAYFQTTTGTPPIVRSLATRLAEGYMWRANSRGSKESLTRAKSFIDDVMNNLKNIAGYKVDLTDTTGALIPDKSNTAYRVLSNTTDYANTFNEDDSLNWAVDPDKLDDISTERE